MPSLGERRLLSIPNVGVKVIVAVLVMVGVAVDVVVTVCVGVSEGGRMVGV
jgi:hypothetical protein